VAPGRRHAGGVIQPTSSLLECERRAGDVLIARGNDTPAGRISVDTQNRPLMDT
jgi:hypothetical protein